MNIFIAKILFRDSKDFMQPVIEKAFGANEEVLTFLRTGFFGQGNMHTTSIAWSVSHWIH